MKPTLFTIAYCVFEQHDPCNVEIGYGFFLGGWLLLVFLLLYCRVHICWWINVD